MNKYNAIVIDDEYHIREGMQIHLESGCPEIHLCGMAKSAAEGRKMLLENNVDIIFLDIAMPGEDGFTFLKSIDASKYAVIFVTAFQEYALNALKANAIDYLLKPVDVTELKEAVTKAAEYLELRRQKPNIMDVYKESIENFQNQVEQNNTVPEKITITEPMGFRVIDLSKVIYLEADNNYTKIHMISDEIFVSAKTLGEYDKMISGPNFYRIHKSYLINLEYLKRYSNLQGSFVEMCNGAILIISRRKINDFKTTFKAFSK